MELRSLRRKALAGVCAVTGVLLVGAPGASAQQDGLEFGPCGAAAGVECATLDVPRDYGAPEGVRWKIFVARSPAREPAKRVGTLFFNLGGPGAPAAEYLEAFGAEGLFPALADRFDIIAMDPRGTGQSSPSIDCEVDQEKLGIYSQPFATPFDLDLQALLDKDRRYFAACLENNPRVFRHVSTADAARDMDLIRSELGESRINYLGFSYGTFLGATYASLFPNRYRSLVLDGPLDANVYINDPLRSLAEQTSGFERALGRFLQACARDQVACSGFGDDDPWLTYDELVDRATASPIPAAGYAPDPRPVDGDDLRAVALALLYSKQAWGTLGLALARAQAGDGTLVRALVDESFYGRDPETEAFDPSTDRYFTLSASEQRYPRRIATFLRAGEESYGLNDHFSLNNGLVELNWGLFPVQARDVFYGPFHVPASSPTALVVNTLYDPATPYRGGVRLTRQLGNARMITMRGDGHTAYSGNVPCIDEAVEAYLIDGVLPPDGLSCRQQVPFAAPDQERSSNRRSGEVRLRLHTKPIVVR